MALSATEQHCSTLSSECIYAVPETKTQKEATPALVTNNNNHYLPKLPQLLPGGARAVWILGHALCNARFGILQQNICAVDPCPEDVELRLVRMIAQFAAGKVGVYTRRWEGQCRLELARDVDMAWRPEGEIDGV